MAKKSSQSGMSPAAKTAIMLVCLGIPALFFGTSYGLSKLFEVAPALVVAVVVIVATAYTSYTGKLLYTFYGVKPPIVRFIPCFGELTLIDVMYQPAGFILYVFAGIMLVCSQLPYAVLSIISPNFATVAPFWFMVAALLLLAVIQVLKGIGLTGCIKDIAAEWEAHTHVDTGGLIRFAPLCFLPFVRVIAMYSLNKPLSTLVSFMGVTAETVSEEADAFTEE